MAWLDIVSEGGVSSGIPGLEFGELHISPLVSVRMTTCVLCDEMRIQACSVDGLRFHPDGRVASIHAEQHAQNHTAAFARVKVGDDDFFLGRSRRDERSVCVAEACGENAVYDL